MGCAPEPVGSVVYQEVIMNDPKAASQPQPQSEMMEDASAPHDRGVVSDNLTDREARELLSLDRESEPD